MCCGKPVQTEEEEYCGDCKKRKFAFRQGKSLFLHKDPVSKAIYDFKFHNKRIFGRAFAKEMVCEYKETLKKWEVKEIIPIPLYRRRYRMRGYNQAEILAKEIGRMAGIPVNSECLYRVKKTTPQKRLDDKSRRKNIAGAFAIDADWIPRGNVLLVDDIYTTGSTLHEAAKLLTRKGCQNVYFLTISIGQGL